MSVDQLQNEEAWIQFVNLDGPLIDAWCRRQLLLGAEGAEIIEAVLAELVRTMRRSQYDPQKGNLSTWLQTVTEIAIREVMRTRKRPDTSMGVTANSSAIGGLFDEEA